MSRHDAILREQARRLGVPMRAAYAPVVRHTARQALLGLILGATCTLTALGVMRAHNRAVDASARADAAQNVSRTLTDAYRQVELDRAVCKRVRPVTCEYR